MSYGSRTDAEAALEPAGVDKGDGTAYHPHQMRFAGGLRPTMERPPAVGGGPYPEPPQPRLVRALPVDTRGEHRITAGHMAARVLGYAIVVHGREPKS